MRKHSRLVALLLCVALAAAPLVACGSVGKTAYNSLTALKAAYVATNASRNDYCHGKTPLPQVCVDSYKPLLAGYETLKQGSALLTVYEQTQTADAKTKLKEFLPVILGAATEVLKTNFSTAPAPTPVPQ